MAWIETDQTHCPKCGAELLYGGTDWSSHPEPNCPYVYCDDMSCRALEDPVSGDEVRAAYEHWRHHGYMHGCSHGS